MVEVGVGVEVEVGVEVGVEVVVEVGVEVGVGVGVEVGVGVVVVVVVGVGDMNPVDSIKAALAQMTPGPWEALKGQMFSSHAVVPLTWDDRKGIVTLRNEAARLVAYIGLLEQCLTGCEEVDCNDYGLMLDFRKAHGWDE